MAKLLVISILILVFVLTMNSYKGIPFPIIFVIALALISHLLRRKRHLIDMYVQSVAMRKQLVYLELTFNVIR